MSIPAHLTESLVPQPRISLVQKFSHRFNIDPSQLLTILKATAFQVKGGGEVTNEQMAALLVVSDQYGLNPFTREIFAFPDPKAGIVPVVSVDGWSRIINDHPQADGIEFRYSDEIEKLADAQPCPAWCEVVIHRKDRSHPTIVREYLDECYRPPFVRQDGSKVRGPWQTHTRRFLRHKTLIQGGRIAFGFGGIYDQDEAERIVDAEAVRVEPELPRGTAGLVAAMERSRTALGAPGAAEPTGAATDAPDVRRLSDAAQAQPDDAFVTMLADNIAALDECSTDGELTEYAADVPEAVRTAPEFERAVAKRREVVKRK